MPMPPPPGVGKGYNLSFAAPGNPNLVPEKADTTGLGVVLQPQFFPGFQASFDYYNIDIDGTIDTAGLGDRQSQRLQTIVLQHQRGHVQRRTGQHQRPVADAVAEPLERGHRRRIVLHQAQHPDQRVDRALGGRVVVQRQGGGAREGQRRGGGQLLGAVDVAQLRQAGGERCQHAPAHEALPEARDGDQDEAGDDRRQQQGPADGLARLRGRWAIAEPQGERRGQAGDGGGRQQAAQGQAAAALEQLQGDGGRLLAHGLSPAAARAGGRGRVPSGPPPGPRRTASAARRRAGPAGCPGRAGCSC